MGVGRMGYKRIRDRDSLIGMFRCSLIGEVKYNLSKYYIKKFNTMSNELDATQHIPQIRKNNIPAYHYFKQGFWDAHKHILNKLLKEEIFELVEIEEHEIKKVWFEDGDQVIIELV